MHRLHLVGFVFFSCQATVFAEAPSLGFAKAQTVETFNAAADRLGLTIRAAPAPGCDKPLCRWQLDDKLELTSLSLNGDVNAYQITVKLSSARAVPKSGKTFMAACQTLIAMVEPKSARDEILLRGKIFASILDGRRDNKERHKVGKPGSIETYADWHVPDRPEPGEGYGECGAVVRQ